MRWIYVNSPHHKPVPREDPDLSAGRIWRASGEHDGRLPVYIASNQTEQIDGETVGLIWHLEVPVADLVALQPQ